MDHTPRPHEMATLLNHHARQSELAMRRTHMTHFPSNGIIKPPPFPPHKVTIDSGTHSKSQSLRANDSRQRAKPLVICSQCGSRSSTYKGAADVASQGCSGCQSLCRSPDQLFMDPIVEVLSSGGTDETDGDCIESTSTLSRDQAQVPPVDHVTKRQDYHSWISSNNLGSPQASTSDSNSAITSIMADEDTADEQLLRRTSELEAAMMHSNDSNDTLDLALFLRTVEPPLSSIEVQREQKKSKNWVALPKFRKRQDSQADLKELTVSSTSNSRTIQRVSKDGTKYLQIVAEPTLVDASERYIGDTSESSNTFLPHRPSTCTSRTDLMGAEEIDALIDEMTPSPELSGDMDSISNSISSWAKEAIIRDGRVYASESKGKGSASDDFNGGFGLSIVEQLHVSPKSERINATTPVPDCEYDARTDGANSGSETPRPRSRHGEDTYSTPLPRSDIVVPLLNTHYANQQIENHQNEHYNGPGVRSFGKDVEQNSNSSPLSRFRKISRNVHRDTPFPQLPELPHFHPLPFAPGLSVHPKKHSYLNPLPPSYKEFPSPPPEPQNVKSSISTNCTTGCSNPQCDKMICRLQSQLDVAERQNKLLEAALHAVLWTAGSLNGCPCSTYTGTASLDRVPSIPRSPGSAEEFASFYSAKVEIKERRPSSTSVGSGKSNVSALGLYKETRL